MLRKILITIVIVGILSVAYFLISPLFINKMVDEKIEDIKPVDTVSTKVVPSVEYKIVGTGNFSGLAGHSANGTAKLIKNDGEYFVRLEDDFNVTNGPDLFVYLGKDGKYDPSAQVAALKGNIGGQNYEIPEGVDPTQYDEVWIWCRAFSVPFAQAVLE